MNALFLELVFEFTALEDSDSKSCEISYFRTGFSTSSSLISMLSRFSSGENSSMLSRHSCSSFSISIVDVTLALMTLFSDGHLVKFFRLRISFL